MRKLNNTARRSFALTLALLLVLAIAPLTSASPVMANTITFSDLAATHWAYAEITSLAQQGVISGFPDGTYRPGDAVTREQFARLVVMLFGERPAEIEQIFSDVANWANPYVTAAVNRGIILPEVYGEIRHGAERKYSTTYTAAT